MQNNYIPLSEIETKLGKKPGSLSKLAREGLITAEKRGNKWYASLEIVQDELRKMLWNRTKNVVRDNVEDILNFVFSILKLILTIVILNVLIEQFLIPKYQLNLSENEIFFLVIFLIPVVYFLIAFPRAFKILYNSSNIWKRLAILEAKNRDLFQEVERLKNEKET